MSPWNELICFPFEFEMAPPLSTFTWAVTQFTLWIDGRLNPSQYRQSSKASALEGGRKRGEKKRGERERKQGVRRRGEEDEKWCYRFSRHSFSSLFIFFSLQICISTCVPYSFFNQCFLFKSFSASIRSSKLLTFPPGSTFKPLFLRDWLIPCTWAVSKCRTPPNGNPQMTIFSCGNILNNLLYSNGKDNLWVWLRLRFTFSTLVLCRLENYKYFSCFTRA